MKHPRQQAHLQMREYMNRGDFFGALEFGQKALEQQGPHLLLRTDIASCQYMIGNFQGYQKNTLAIYQDLQDQQNKINEETFLGTSLGTGKLLEELGCIYLAKKIYSQALSATPSSQSKLIEMIQAQYLRLLCLFPLDDELSKFYLLCEQVRAQSNALAVDVQLALLHADIYVLGLHQVQTRIELLLANEKTPLFNKRLLTFDYLFECLRLNRANQFQKKYLDIFEYSQCDAFERNLWDIYINLTSGRNFDGILLSSTSEMSPLCGLRFLLALYTLQTNFELTRLIRKKLHLILNSIEPKSRALLIKVWNISQKEHISLIELDGPSSSVVVAGNLLNLQGSPLIFNLLRELSKTTEISAEQIIQQLYQTEFDENSFHRLRMLVKRTNQKLMPLTGFENFITLKKMTLSLDSKIRIKAA